MLRLLYWVFQKGPLELKGIPSVQQIWGDFCCGQGKCLTTCYHCSENMHRRCSGTSNSLSPSEFVYTIFLDFRIWPIKKIVCIGV